MLKLGFTLFIVLLSFMVLATPGKAAEDAMQISQIHKLITHQQGWLNTSRPLKPEDLKGRIILLDFWTYCCINCMHVIPDLKYLEDTFGDQLTVIGIHSAKFKNEGDSENIRQAILRYGIHHAVANDFDFSTWKGFGIRAWPTFVLINPQGLIEEVYSGEGNRASAEHDIAQLIKKYEGKVNKDPLPIALEQDKQPPSVLNFPSKLAYGRYGAKDSIDALYIADTGHQRIVVAKLDGTILDTIGSGKPGHDDGDFRQASFNTPQGLALNFPMLYVADTNNHLLRAIDLVTRKVTTLAGTGKQGNERDVHKRPALETPLSSPWDLAFYPDDNHIVMAMAGLHQLWSYDIADNTVSIIAGNGHESIDDGHLPDNSLSQPSGLSVANGKLYFVDAETSSLRLFEDGAIKTLIGTGLFDFGYKEGVQGVALMQHPLGVFADGNDIYVADSYNHSIRRYDVKTKTLSNFAGHGTRGKHDGAFKDAEFNEPNDLLQIGKKIYIADTNNNAIRIADLENKKVSTLSINEQKNSAAEFNDELPNTEKSDAVSVTASKAATISLALKGGWHINKDAPSYLALFDTARKPVASFDIEAVKTQRVTLPKLPDGNYRLQGTLYYCEDKIGSQCLLKSFDVPLTAGGKGQDNITLELN